MPDNAPLSTRLNPTLVYDGAYGVSPLVLNEIEAAGSAAEAASVAAGEAMTAAGEAMTAAGEAATAASDASAGADVAYTTAMNAAAAAAAAHLAATDAMVAATAALAAALAVITPVSEFWARPAVAHANNQEFDSPVLPPWTLFNLSSTGVGVGTAGTLVTTPPADLTTDLTGAQTRLIANGKRSWLHMQTSNDGLFRFYGFKMTLLPRHVFRARLATMFGSWASAPTAYAGDVELCVACDNGANAPSFDAAGVRMGWASGLLSARYHSGGVTQTAASWLSTPTSEHEVMLIKSPTGKWMFAVRDAATTHYLGQVDFAGALENQSVWVGFRFAGKGDLPDAINRHMSADYYRQQDDHAGLYL